MICQYPQLDLDGRRSVGGNPQRPKKLRETPSLQAGPRPEELAGEASRTGIASAIHTAHAKKINVEEKPVIRSFLWCQVHTIGDARDAESRFFPRLALALGIGLHQNWREA